MLLDYEEASVFPVKLHILDRTDRNARCLTVVLRKELQNTESRSQFASSRDDYRDAKVFRVAFDFDCEDAGGWVDGDFCGHNRVYGAPSSFAINPATILPDN